MITSPRSQPVEPVITWYTRRFRRGCITRWFRRRSAAFPGWPLILRRHLVLRPFGYPGRRTAPSAVSSRTMPATWPGIDRKGECRASSAASRAYADGVHGRIWPSRPSVRRGTLLYAPGVSRGRTPSARTLTTRWRWRTGSPVDWTQETHAYQVPSLSCLSQHSRWPITPPVISTMGGDHGVRAYSPPSCAATRS